MRKDRSVVPATTFAYPARMTRPDSLDLSARTCVVTGANSGIGKEVARGLASYGAEVVLACRSLDRGRAALEELEQDTGSQRLHLMQVDLSVQGDVRRFAQELLERFGSVLSIISSASLSPSLSVSRDSGSMK